MEDLVKTKKQSLGLRIVNYIVIIIGFAIGKYYGLYFFIPAAICAAV